MISSFIRKGGKYLALASLSLLPISVTADSYIQVSFSSVDNYDTLFTKFIQKQQFIVIGNLDLNKPFSVASAAPPFGDSQSITTPAIICEIEHSTLNNIANEAVASGLLSVQILMSADGDIWIMQSDKEQLSNSMEYHRFQTTLNQVHRLQLPVDSYRCMVRGEETS